MRWVFGVYLVSYMLPSFCQFLDLLHVFGLLRLDLLSLTLNLAHSSFNHTLVVTHLLYRIKVNYNLRIAYLWDLP